MKFNPAQILLGVAILSIAFTTERVFGLEDPYSTIMSFMCAWVGAFVASRGILRAPKLLRTK